MSYNNTRIVNVSMSTIKSQIEAWLRATSMIDDKEDVIINFGDEVMGKTLKDTKWQEELVVPVHIKYKQIGVKLIKV